MKKIMSLVLVVVLVFSLSGCKIEDEKPSPSPSPTLVACPIDLFLPPKTYSSTEALIADIKNSPSGMEDDYWKVGDIERFYHMSVMPESLEFVQIAVKEAYVTYEYSLGLENSDDIPNFELINSVNLIFFIGYNGAVTLNNFAETGAVRIEGYPNVVYDEVTLNEIYYGKQYYIALENNDFISLYLPKSIIEQYQTSISSKNPKPLFEIEQIVVEK